MPQRSSWKGFLRLSLVSIPVKAYTVAASGGDIRLGQLHQDCHSPIKYRKVCPLHGEIGTGAIVRGYQYAKGHYVVIDPEELEDLRTASDKAINIDGFLRAGALDPVYFSGKNYYLLPDGPVGEKAYFLTHRVMEERGLYAVARVVLSAKEQLTVLGPMNGLLVMATLRYESQLRPPSAFAGELRGGECSEEELVLTKKLIEATVFKDFDLSRYKNAYTERLTQLIEAKVESKEIVAAPSAEEPKILELMDALRRSVREAEKRERGGRGKRAVKGKKKMAPSTPTKRTPKRRRTPS